ncbi:LLM class flavin-dependent oxidoreductase [Microbacterium sp. SS28]|uniref:LLM class flavin-dependent oxidoreductase n=1 Tax=Microbacterium sp. SS28 TaxID=2919948 RepID=UPI001FAA39F6|nr:LLM class flavin-dependent oxidoreductase [Microbacterium sp. SS28]
MTSLRHGIMLPRDLAPDLILAFAREVERLGFDEVWVVEDLGFRGGIAQAAAVLAATDRLTVGIGILPAAVRSVAFEAMEVATLAQMFPGRLDVGIGHGMPGWMRSLGVWPERPLAFLAHHVETLRALLRGDHVAVRTEDPDDLVALDPVSVPVVAPEILLGVRGPKSLRVSGRVADGTVLAEPATPEYVRAAIEKIAADGPHRIVAYNVAAVADDETEALRLVRPAVEWIGEPDWAPHLAPLDIAEDFAALRSECADRAEFVERIPDAWLSRLTLAGTPDQVRAKVDALAAAGVTSSVMIPAGPDPIAASQSLARALPAR